MHELVIVFHSLTTSKHFTHAWVTVLTAEDDCLKLSTLDKLPFSCETSFVNKMNKVQEIGNYSPHIVNIDAM